MSRLRSALYATALILAATQPVLAATDTSSVQTQLQSEWDAFTTRLGTAATSQGDVKVTQSGNSYKATLPTLTMTLQENNTLKLDNVTVTATPSLLGALNLKLTLPSTIPQFYQTQQIGSLSIGKQDLNIVVKPAGDTWQVQSIDGTLNNLHWQHTKNTTSDPHAPSDGTVSQVTLNGKPNQLSMTMQSIKTRTMAGDSQSIDQINLTQQPSTAQSLRLSDVLMLLAGTVPQLNNGRDGMSAWMQGSASMTAHITHVVGTRADGKPALSIDDIVMKNSLVSLTDHKMTINTIGTIKGITPSLPPAFSDLAPRTIDFTATLRNMPVDYAANLSRNTPAGQAAAHAALANAGTQIQIDSLNIATDGGLKANGTGLLAATNTAPIYMTGTVTLNIANLQDSLAKIQQQMKTNGAKGQGQTLLALMMLQSMGQPNGKQTQYVINFTPTGQILLNNQDLTGLIGMAHVGGSALQAAPARSIPVAPVTTQNATPIPPKKP